jgi:serine O-acetyltransferase
MNEIIKRDLYRYIPKPYSFTVLLRGLRSQGFRYMFFFRLTNLASNGVTRLFYRLLLRRYVFKYGFQIPHNASIGEGFHISHFGLVIINDQVVIGKNCNINQGVTIGQANRGERKGCPAIGSKVWMGANAVIVGKISIGDDVLIAPGAYVNIDVPSHSIVVGNPCKIISRENATYEYICNVLE